MIMSPHAPSTKPRCQLDRTILNNTTITQMTNIGLSIFAPLCPRNRGIFVTSPPDGHTYSCASFPDDYAMLSGVQPSSSLLSDNFTLDDSNAIVEGFNKGNITADDAVNLLDYLVERVYDTTAGVETLPYGCDVSGLARLSCDDKNDEDSQKTSLLPDGGVVRSVTMTGAFIRGPWSSELSTVTYTRDDFGDMVAAGVNTIQIPVPLKMFLNENDDGDQDMITALGDVLHDVHDAGLYAIIDLVVEKSEDDNDNVTNHVATTTAAATFLSKVETKPIIAIILPSPSYIPLVRKILPPHLPLLLSLTTGDLPHLPTLPGNDDNIHIALDLSHASSPADVASSTSRDDRIKLCYHEMISCNTRSIIDYARCFLGQSVYIAKGFDLAIDDCVSQKQDPLWRDYGQCDRFDETVDSDWWYRHRQSLAERKWKAFETEGSLGWSFSAWLIPDDDNSTTAATDVMDSPEKLLSLKHVIEAGLLSLENETGNEGAEGMVSAPVCLNPPDADFILGDDTLAPTPGPPPDCGNGWWNYTTEQCDYWIPPPPPPPCTPIEDDNSNSNDVNEYGDMINVADFNGTIPADMTAMAHGDFMVVEYYDSTDLGLAALGGAVITVVVGAVVWKMSGGVVGMGRRREQYFRLP